MTELTGIALLQSLWGVIGIHYSCQINALINELMC